MISAVDSEMARLTALHGGGEFVSFSTAEAVAEGICRLYERRDASVYSGGLNPYRSHFGPEEVVGGLWRWLEERG